MVATVTPSVFKMVSSYAGIKSAYIEVASMSSADILDLSGHKELYNVLVINLFQIDGTNGNIPLTLLPDAYSVPITYGNKLTLKTGAITSAKIAGIVYWRY